MKKHTLQTLCTAALISLGLSFTAMGEERITDVSLIFSYDQSPEAVSYTHLDVYKRQAYTFCPCFKSSSTTALPIKLVAPVTITAIWLSPFLSVVLPILPTGNYSLILGMIIFRSISSSGRKGARSSKGGDTRVPSGSLLAEDFGSKF